MLSGFNYENMHLVKALIFPDLDIVFMIVSLNVQPHLRHDYNGLAHASQLCLAASRPLAVFSFPVLCAVASQLYSGSAMPCALDWLLEPTAPFAAASQLSSFSAFGSP